MFKVEGSDYMKYFSVKEISELLLVNEETVRRWIRDEKLEAERGSGRQGSKVSSEALSKFLEENRGAITTLAATTLGLNVGKVVGAAGSMIAGAAIAGAGPIAAGVIAGAISILKSQKSKTEKKIELMEKETDLFNIATKLKNEIAGLKNEIAVRENELENIERKLLQLSEIANKVEDGDIDNTIE